MQPFPDKINWFMLWIYFNICPRITFSMRGLMPSKFPAIDPDTSITNITVLSVSTPSSTFGHDVSHLSLRWSRSCSAFTFSWSVLNSSGVNWRCRHFPLTTTVGKRPEQYWYALTFKHSVPSISLFKRSFWALRPYRRSHSLLVIWNTKTGVMLLLGLFHSNTNLDEIPTKSSREGISNASLRFRDTGALLILRVCFIRCILSVFRALLSSTSLVVKTSVKSTSVGFCSASFLFEWLQPDTILEKCTG